MANKNSRKVRSLVLASLFVALDFLFTRIFCINLMGGAERISLQFLASAVCGWVMGPWWGAAAAGVADLVGALIGTSGLTFFPGFTLTAALRGLCYGLLLHRKKVSFPRCLLATGVSGIVLGLLLNSFWLTFYMGKNFLAYVTAKAPFQLILFPLQAVVLYLVLRSLKKHDFDKKAMALPPEPRK